MVTKNNKIPGREHWTQKQIPLLGSIRRSFPFQAHRSVRTEGGRPRKDGSTFPHDARGDRKTALLAFTPAFLTAAASAYVPMEASLVLPLLGFVIMAVFFGLVVLWWQAETGRQTLAIQLAGLEQEERTPAAPLVLRPPVLADSPVTVLRELALSVSLQEASAETSPMLPERVQAARFPEPSLLPSMRNPSAEEVSRMRLVTQAFEADRIELHLQPVVSLPHGKIRFYEALARLRLADGTLLGPAEFLPLLEASGRASDFDRRVLIRSMAIARHLVARGSEAIVGVNLTAHSIAEPGFLWSLAGLLDTSPDLLGKIVLEMPQHSWRHLDADHRAALAILRERGVPFSPGSRHRSPVRSRGAGGSRHPVHEAAGRSHDRGGRAGGWPLCRAGARRARFRLGPAPPGHPAHRRAGRRGGHGAHALRSRRAAGAGLRLRGTSPGQAGDCR